LRALFFDGAAHFDQGKPDDDQIGPSPTRRHGPKPHTAVAHRTPVPRMTCLGPRRGGGLADAIRRAGGICRIRSGRGDDFSIGGKRDTRIFDWGAPLDFGVQEWPAGRTCR
jgi:hypothetical protein